MRTVTAALAFAAAVGLAAAGAPPVIPSAPPIHAASQYTKHVRSVSGGSLSAVAVPGATAYKLVHLHGSTHQRGLAYGSLLADDIVSLVDKMDDFYKSEVTGIPWAKLGLPKWLESALENTLADAAPTIFETALGWVFDKQHPHLLASRVQPLAEIKGISEGICSTLKTPCNATTWELKLQKLNMLPELIRMTCSMIGAHGSATADGKLLQLRTLDFGGGPFANHTVLAVHHPTGAEGVPFAAISFSGLVGVVTGFSQHIAMSEKVWETYRSPDVQPGTYSGMPVVMIIREMLQFSKSKAEAIAIATHAQRTWAVLLGVGDAETMQFNALGYKEKSLAVYDDANMSSVTNAADPPAGASGKGGNAAPIKDIVYIDRHPQPSTDPTLHKLLQGYHGKLTAEMIAQNVPRLTHSGDVHTMTVDFEKKDVLIQIGSIGPGDEGYGPGDEGYAAYQPISRWTSALWTDSHQLEL